MRKLFAILGAVILALAVVVSVIWFKEGIPLDQITGTTVKEYILEKINDYRPEPEDSSIPEITEVNVIEIETEPSMTYNERIKKGDYFFDRGFLTFATNEYVKAANLEPDRIEPYEKLLHANFELGDYKKAQRNAEIILKLDPDHFNTQLTLIQIYIKQSTFDGAESLLGQLNATLEKPNAYVEYYRALLRIAQSEYTEAKKILKQAKVASKSDELDEKIDKILAAYREYEFAQAAEELYLAELLARSLNQVGEYEIAINKLKEILRQRNDLRDSWILLGFSYLNLEKYYFALTAFEKAYDLDSEWPVTQYFLGLTHAELSQFEDAILYLNYSLTNGFEPPIVIHSHLADLYLDAQDYSKSVQSYVKVLEANKSDIGTFIRPIWIYLDFLNQPEEALKLAEMSVLTFPEDSMSYNLLGWSQVGTKDYIEAEKNLKKAIELNPNLAAAHYNLGKLYEVQNRNKMALEVYQKAFELDQNSSIGNLAAKRYNELLTE